METRKPNIIVHGPFANHDQACASCHVEPAVYELDSGTFQPCWGCQKRGLELVYAPKKWQRRIIAMIGVRT